MSVDNIQEIRQGKIQVDTKDIFPIIKKWLYSEHDIFTRELVSNASDAIHKRKILSSEQNLSCPEGLIQIELDSKEKTITFIDNGLGMTAAEVEKYLAQLAFSGAQEFVEKMSKLQGKDVKDHIIGKFGLGFYSVFMVAKKVEVESLSMTPGSTPCHWVCEGDPEYTFLPSQRTAIGTKITLHLNEESQEQFANTHQLGEILRRYCDFMPYPIELIDLQERSKQIAENLTKEKPEERKEYTPEKINDSTPLWKKNPSEVSAEEYKEFYQRLFPFDAPPLFWIHLNIDHPFHLQGILYFPKVNPQKPVQERAIKLYNKQVFVSDQIKDIIPEFLSLMKGAIDSSDIPLNVSRSALQGDPNIKKISNYIIKKVAESLKKLFEQEKERYESYWSDLALFVKYGVLSDDKFDDIMRPGLLFKNTAEQLTTLEQYQQQIPTEWQETLKGKIIFVSQDNQQQHLRKQVKEWGIEVIEMDSYLDVHLMQHLEMKVKGDGIKFVALDNEYERLLAKKQELNPAQELDQNNGTAADAEALKVLLTETMKDYPEQKNSNPYEIQTLSLASQDTCAYLKTDQQMKRWEQMSRSFSMGNDQAGAFQAKKTLVFNAQHPLGHRILAFSQNDQQRDLAKQVIFHLVDLAKLSSDGMDVKEKEAFITRSQKLLESMSQQLPEIN